MSSRSRSAVKHTFLKNLFGRKQKAGHSSGTRPRHRGRSLQIEGLEKREMFAVTAVNLIGSTLQVVTDNNATTVNVEQVGSNYRISEIGTTKTWSRLAMTVTSVEFIGGAGNDRFFNNVANLPSRAWGNGGHDWLEGFNAKDEFYGGEGNDTLVGYGGDDYLRGGGGNDVIRGMAGVDTIAGEGGNDYLDGGTENDWIWGGEGDDVLLGGAGDDNMDGESGHDQLNGQAGLDKMWGKAGNDVLISLDAGYTDWMDSGTGYDTMWVDGPPSFLFNFSDTIYDVASIDVVQKVGAFANGVDTTLDGDNIGDPLDIGTKVRFTNTITANNISGTNPLFADLAIGGPTAADIEQNALGDCWLLAGLGAIAIKNQNVIRQNVVDFNDGTYGVRLGNSFYRVDNELGINNAATGAVAGNVRFAGLGVQDSLWVAIVEKAYAYHRSVILPTYSANVSGVSTELFAAFRLKNISTRAATSYIHPSLMAADLYSKWTQGYAICIGTIAVNTGGYHGFSVERINVNSAGTVTDIVLRNPWATDSLNRFPVFAGANAGSSNEGLFTVTVAQLFSSGGSFRFGQV